MAIPPRLKTELDDLSNVLTLEVLEETDMVNVIFKGFALGPGFSIPNSDLLVRIPKTYPDAGPDMFWTSPEVTFRDGRIPQSAEHVENWVGQRWRRFSWHRARWTPNVDNIHGYLQFIRKRLGNTN